MTLAASCAIPCLLLAAGALASALAFPARPGRAAPPAEPADLVVFNGRVWTGNPALPEATALVVRAGRIALVTKVDAEAQAHVGPGTRTIDAQGRRVTPGLIDTHVHLVSAAQQRARLELRDASSRADLLDRVRRAAERLPRDAWIVGRGWSAESWPDRRPPTAEEIDEASGGRPTALIRMDGHSMLAGGAALARAEISDKGPSDPPGGRIGRRADGAPTGEVFEEAMELVLKHAPVDSPQHVRELVRAAVAEAASFGITRVGSMEPRRAVEEALVPLDEAGLLDIRVDVTIMEPPDTIEEWRPILDWCEAHRQASPSVRVIGVKGFMDGSLGSRTAWMTEPYLDNPPGADPRNAGMPLAMAGSGEMRELILEAASRGLQPTVHAIGDRAAHALLGWFAEIPAEQRERVRPRMEHAQHLLASDIPRFRELGVIASMQPLHKADDGRYAESRLGIERLRAGGYAYRQLFDARAPVAFGSDWPVVAEDPLLGIRAATEGRAMDGRAFLPESSCTPEEALVAYTRAGAHCLHAEDRCGVLKAGADADFVVHLDDPLRPTGADGRVALTVVGGRVVHELR